MRGTTSLIFVGIVAVAVLAALAFGGTFGDLFAIEPARNIYCNDFEFITCAEKLTPTYITPSGSTFVWQCPTTANRCVFNGQPGQTYTVYTSCTSIGSCSGQIRVFYGSATLAGGEWVKRPSGSSWGSGVQVYELGLFFCGKSACSNGVPVPGASGCSFVPSQAGTGDRIYDQNGHLLDPANQGLYTVPPGTSYLYTSHSLRRVCGDTGESCTANTDCAAGHPYTITRNGETLGVEFQTGQMVVYGCKQLPSGECIEKDIIGGQENCIAYATAMSYCGDIEYKPTECIPGSSSCGPNAVCKAVGDHFECVEPEDKTCTYDWECGEMIGCDWNTRTLKDNYCNTFTGHCAVQSTPVECCYDANCGGNRYCDSDYKCKDNINPKTQCPYDCCMREAQYIDKICADDMECCSHTCKYQCDSPDPTPENPWLWLVIPIFAALFALVGYLGMDIVGAAMGGILGGMLGYGIYWFLTLAPWLQWLIAIGLGVGGAGLIYVMLFGGGLMALALFYALVKD